jgi:hypothetical protein
MKNDDQILFDKDLRVRIQIVIDLIRAASYKSAERTLAFRALQSARHWLGEDLAVLGAQHPYPNGNNPDNAIVDPPADVALRRDVEAQLDQLKAEFGMPKSNCGSSASDIGG